nr:hypothetical protein [Tanacetum cinerariifolium]
MHKAFSLLVRKFPLSEGTSHCLKKNATAKGKVLPLPEVCTVVIVKEKPPSTTTSSTTSGDKSGRTVTLTIEDVQKKKNDVKARTTLLLSLPDGHQLRFSQLQFMGVEVEQDDLNQKFLTSFAPEWLMHTIVWRNRSDLDTMSLDDLYNHLKDWSYMANDEEDHALVAEAPTEFALMADTSTENKVFDNSLCSKDCKKTNGSLNSKITDLTDKLFDAKNMIYHYKLALAQVECRLVEYKEREIKYIEKIRTLEFYDKGKVEYIETLKKELETLKQEKEVVDGKLAGLLSASKNLDNLIESQRLDKSKEGLGYTVVHPPVAQLYLSPKKDLSLTGLPECADDTVTDYSRPSPTVESSSEENQNINPSAFENVTSPITPKQFVKFVKASDRGCKITRKGTIKTDKHKFENVYFVKDLKYNLFSVSQICDNKNNVLFTDSECIVLGRDFKLLDDANILLRTPRQHNMYSVNLNNIVPHIDLICLVAKASADECNLWHRRLGHLNFKTINKLVRYNLVRGLPTKCFENDHNCTAFLKGKQHKAYCKSKSVTFVTKPLHTLHMDLFGPTSVSSISHKWCCLVVTDDFSRFTWTFFLRIKDETSSILRKFITKIENLKDLKVKIIRCDNGGEFRNKELNDFCLQKGIKREFSNARTPQQNGVPERRNRVLVNKAHNKTPYELFNGRTPAIGFLKPFGFHVMIFNTLDNLGKFETKGDKGYFLGYLMSSKAFRIFNKRTKKVEENVHIEFLENKAIEKGYGPKWLFDIDSLTKSLNYVPVVDAGTHSTNFSGTTVDASKDMKKGVSSLRYIVLPNWGHEEHLESTSSQPQGTRNTDAPESNGNLNPTTTLTNPSDDPLETLTVETPIPTASSPVLTVCFTDSQEPLNILGDTSNSEKLNGVKADVSNMEITIIASPTPTFMIHRDHPKSQIIGPVDTPIQTRNKSKEKVWSLVDCPKGVRPIGTKWVLKNKKDERGIVIKNKARLVAQWHTQEEGIDYDELFTHVARIEAIRLFLAYASFMGFTVYQMDVKSVFLYGTIDEEVYVMQPPRFQNLEYSARVYKVEKAMYGLHQAPRAWYGTLSKYLLSNGFQRGKIDQTLFIRRQRGDFILVQVYVDDIIFGSLNP